MARYYAGIGSRETPQPFLEAIRDMAIRLALQRMTLRSGGAPGADTAFERGHLAATMAAGRKVSVDEPEIYLPWAGFNGHESSLHARDLPAQATVIAREHHPNWAVLKPAARWMHIRNVAQVLGADCKTPVEFVLCWTPGGAGTGGTGQAIRIARAHDIPVYDMGAYALPFIRRKLASVHGVQV